MTATARPAKQDRTTLVLLFIAALVAVGGIGFALGHLTAPSASAAGANPSAGRGGFGRNLPSLAPGQTFNPAQFGGGVGGGLGGGGRLGGVTGGVTGTVQSVTATTMTIQEANGNTVTIDLTGATTYHSETAATADQVKTGTTVTVQIDTTALASQTPSPGASGGRTITAKDILITTP